MAKLKKAHLIIKKKKNGKQQQQQTTANGYGYELTDLGLTVYGIVMILRRAEDLRMNLEAIDALMKICPMKNSIN